MRCTFCFVSLLGSIEATIHFMASEVPTRERPIIRSCDAATAWRHITVPGMLHAAQPVAGVNARAQRAAMQQHLVPLQRCRCSICSMAPHVSPRGHAGKSCAVDTEGRGVCLGYDRLLLPQRKLHRRR